MLTIRAAEFLGFSRDVTRAIGDIALGFQRFDIASRLSVTARTLSAPQGDNPVECLVVLQRGVLAVGVGLRVLIDLVSCHAWRLSKRRISLHPATTALQPEYEEAGCPLRVESRQPRKYLGLPTRPTLAVTTMLLSQTAGYMVSFTL